MEQSEINKFCDALQNGTLLCIIHGRAANGMSMNLGLYCPDPNIQYRNFHKLMSFTGLKRHPTKDGFKIENSGMDATHATIHHIVTYLDRKGLLGNYNAYNLINSRITTL